MFWCATSITLWIVWNRTNEETVLYFAVFSSIFLVLITIKWLKEFIKNKKIRKCRIQEEKNRIASQEAYFKKIIWRFFATVNEEYLRGASQLLEFRVVEGNEDSRFISRDEQNTKIYGDFVWPIICHMRIQREIGGIWELIRVEQMTDGWFLHFEPYFLDLLQHYKSTGERKFL